MTSKIPLLTFDELFELFENNQIENEVEKRIVEKIIEAETDWIITIYSLNDFLVILEKEIEGKTTKSNLERLLKKYSQNLGKYAWESESIASLLSIFEMTSETELRDIFYELSEKFKSKI